MDNLPLVFRNNFLRYFELSGYTSFRSLSLESQSSAARAQKIADGEFDNSAVGPGLFTVDRMCRNLNCTPNDLLGYSSGIREPKTVDRIGEPSVEKLVQCYVRSAGHINGFSDYLSYCQIYDEPKDGRIFLRASGRLSLASRTAKTTDVQYLQDQFFEFPEADQRAIFAGQRRAWDNGMSVEPNFLNHPMPEKAARARFDFLRAAFRTHMADGSEGLVVYCSIIGQ